MKARVLIAPQWIVTAAHAVEWRVVDEVMIDGECRKAERLIVHPGYRSIPAELYSGYSGPAMQAQASRDDIALIKLAEPIDDVAPVELYRGDDEVVAVVMLIGKGTTAAATMGRTRMARARTARSCAAPSTSSRASMNASSAMCSIPAGPRVRSRG